MLINKKVLEIGVPSPKEGLAQGRQSIASTYDNSRYKAGLTEQKFLTARHGMTPKNFLQVGRQSVQNSVIKKVEPMLKPIQRETLASLKEARQQRKMTRITVQSLDTKAN
jgi:hypothetical protein